MQGAIQNSLHWIISIPGGPETYLCVRVFIMAVVGQN